MLHCKPNWNTAEQSTCNHLPLVCTYFCRANIQLPIVLEPLIWFCHLSKPKKWKKDPKMFGCSERYQ